LVSSPVSNVRCDPFDSVRPDQLLDKGFVPAPCWFASRRSPVQTAKKSLPDGAWSNPVVVKETIRTVTVPRGVTITLLVALSAVMAGLIAGLSGRAYLGARLTIPEVISFIHQYDAGTVSNDALLATAAPGIADMLFFMPWGAIAFLAFDGGEQHRMRTYLLTLAVGVTFALCLVAWQSTLPTRVTGWDDAGWNMLGCLTGALAGHLRKRVRVRFD
jgi:glycopeptide antibiotics resistance protein